LANAPQLTLLQYLQSEIGRLGSATIRIEDLKDWLGSYPWLLVLDGLDEVPPSSNRQEVMRQLEHFQVDAASQNADILIVITTRPQSYSKEFPSDLFQHLYLMPLSPKQALDYGRRLAQARCSDDERRCDELVRSLEKACETEMTARLMQNPLQITIMATLLEETGEPPQQRYRLFAEYYRTIYGRETRRRLLDLRGALQCFEPPNTPTPLSPEWIDFFDWLGRQQPSFYWGNDDWQHTEQLVYSFAAAPEARRGLLPLLVALAASGNKCEVPREVPRVCRGWDARAKEYSVLLSLARGDWTSEEIPELAKNIARNKPSGAILWQAFHLLRRFPMTRSANFALAVLRHLPTSGQQRIEAMDASVSALSEYLNKRPGPLKDLAIWHRLNLPEHV
jgi:hypothetical protein